MVSTRSIGSSYVVMKTSTVPAGGASGPVRTLTRHIVIAKKTVSTRLYVSAITSGTAIHQADQLTEASQRQAT